MYWPFPVPAQLVETALGDLGELPFDTVIHVLTLWLRGLFCFAQRFAIDLARRRFW